MTNYLLKQHSFLLKPIQMVDCNPKIELITHMEFLLSRGYGKKTLKFDSSTQIKLRQCFNSHITNSRTLKNSQRTHIKVNISWFKKSWNYKLSWFVCYHNKHDMLNPYWIIN